MTEVWQAPRDTLAPVTPSRPCAPRARRSAYGYGLGVSDSMQRQLHLHLTGSLVRLDEAKLHEVNRDNNTFRFYNSHITKPHCAKHRPRLQRVLQRRPQCFVVRNPLTDKLGWFQGMNKGGLWGCRSPRSAGDLFSYLVSRP